jgi:hypothetical protein
MCFLGGCGSFCLLSLFESRQNAGFRAKLVVAAESHVVDHGFEVTVQAEDHAPLVEFALGAGRYLVLMEKSIFNSSLTLTVPPPALTG